MGARNRAKQDEKGGDLGTARQRLMSLHNSQGYDPGLCRDIGILSQKMQDPVEAGRWLLISKVNESSLFDAPIEMFLASCNYDRAVVLARLPRVFKRVRFEDLPKAVKVRLDALGIDRLPGTQTQPTRAVSSKLWGSLGAIGCFVVVVALIGTFIVGLGTIVEWVFD